MARMPMRQLIAVTNRITGIKWQLHELGKYALEHARANPADFEFHYAEALTEEGYEPKAPVTKSKAFVPSASGKDPNIYSITELEHMSISAVRQIAKNRGLEFGRVGKLEIASLILMDQKQKAVELEEATEEAEEAEVGELDDFGGQEED